MTLPSRLSSQGLIFRTRSSRSGLSRGRLMSSPARAASLYITAVSLPTIVAASLFAGSAPPDLSSQVRNGHVTQRGASTPLGRQRRYLGRPCPARGQAGQG